MMGTVSIRQRGMSLFSDERLRKLQAEAGSAAEPTHSVLIVDDEPGNLTVLRAFLERRYRVLTASSGSEALALIDQLPAEQLPCLTLSDQRMPGMSGVELFEQLRERLPLSIRIILTGYIDVADIVDAINRAGIYKFMVKPIEREDLLLTVERAIEAYEMRRQIDRHIEELEEKVRQRTRELAERNEQLQRAYSEIERSSLTDPLTGLGNRRMVLKALEPGKPEVLQERRSSAPSRLALFLVDIDHFKSVNDEFGHAAGDAVLSGVAEILRAHCSREEDLAARWGGEEFLLMMAVGSAEEAMDWAARIRRAVEEARFPIGDGKTLQRTCSIGVCCAGESTPFEQRLGLADEALYRAKRSGRNRVVGLMTESDLAAPGQGWIAQHVDALIADGAVQQVCERS